MLVYYYCKAIDAITKLVNVLAAGDLPNEAAPFFCGARLYGWKKPSGGIRLIAIGDIIRWLLIHLGREGSSALGSFPAGCGGQWRL